MRTVENTDNDSRKNNIKRWSEGTDLKQFLDEAFTAGFGADSEIVIQILSAFRVGGGRGPSKRPRDIMLKLPS